MRFPIAGPALLVTSLFLVSACDLEDPFDDDGDGSGDYTTATIGHDGFDFSANTAGYSQNYDGETIGWQPGGADHPSYARDAYVWWRPATGGTADMGSVSMASVTQAPTSWEASPNITPLLQGHVYVARCADGYVKFKVISVDPSGQNWPAQVEFYYSASGSFDR